MTIEEKKAIEREFRRVKEILEENGIAYEEHNPFVSFSNEHGECWVFPSQTFDGKLCVRYTTKTWCDTAESALLQCGVIEW